MRQGGQIVERRNTTPVWLKFLFPVLVFGVHLLFITQERIWNLHWILYIALFIYVTSLGETKKIVREIYDNLKQISFLIKVLAVFLLTLAVVLAILNISSESIYPLWMPFWNPLLFLPWILLYVLIQPLVDTVVFEKWLIGSGEDGGAWMKAGALLAMLLRTYIETGEIVVKNGEISMASLAYYMTVAIPILFYLFTKKASVSYLGEVLYRISIAVMIMAVFWGK